MLPLGGMLLSGVALSAAARLGLVGAVRTSVSSIGLVVKWWCTRSVGIAPLLIGCIATYRVHCDVTGAAPLVWTSCYRRGGGRLRGLRQRRHQLGSFFWGVAGPVSRYRAFRPADAACLRGSRRGCRRLLEEPLHVATDSRRHHGAGRGMSTPEPGPGGGGSARRGAVSGARCQAGGGILGE